MKSKFNFLILSSLTLFVRLLQENIRRIYDTCIVFVLWSHCWKYVQWVSPMISYLLISKTKLSARISRNVYPAEKQSPVIRHRTVSSQLVLHDHVILLVYHIVNAVAVNQEILLKYPIFLFFNFVIRYVVTLLISKNFLNSAVSHLFYTNETQCGHVHCVFV